jgi:DUF971 family protein
MKPLSIKRDSDGLITIVWDDGVTTECTAEELRDGCPCAECQGETVLLHTYPPIPRLHVAGHYDIKAIVPVGSYAVQITWGDGHATGLYTWNYLRQLTLPPS